MSIYYSPEESGLKVVAEVEYSDLSYQFDMRVVWQHMSSGKLYTARDMGCSCPSPFEDYTKLEDLDELVDMADLRSEIRADECGNLTPEQGQVFLDKVEDVLRRGA